jgi:hypothetical protein
MLTKLSEMMNAKMSLEELSQISGGGKFWDGFCATIGLADGAVFIGLIVLNPVSGAILCTASLGCAIYLIANQNN